MFVKIEYRNSKNKRTFFLETVEWLNETLSVNMYQSKKQWQDL